MLIAVLWLATRPYKGIVYDGLLYTVWTLRELDPARFADDLYFRFGSPAQFTIFPKLYQVPISLLGVGTAAIAVTAVGQLLWLGGLWHLARSLLSDRWRGWVAVAMAVALPGTYGAYQTYGDAYLTPRLFAEALTMTALGFLLRRRAGWALAIIALSLAIHPLMPLPGLTVAILYLALRQPLWWAASGAAAVAVAGFSLADVEPFANLHRTLDPQWFDIVKVHDVACWITRWPMTAYLRLVATASLAALALVVAEPAQRRFLAAVMIVGIGGLMCTYLGADLAHNAFIVEIQPSRSMWLLALVANLYALPAFLKLRRDRPGSAASVSLAGALTALALSRYVTATMLIAAPLLVCACIAGSWQSWIQRELPFPARLLLLMMTAAGCFVTVLVTWYVFRIEVQTWPSELWMRTVYSFALVLMAIGLAVFLVIRASRRRPVLRGWSPLVAAVLLAIALLGWDARPPWTKFVESPRAPPSSLTGLLPEHASAYWEGGLDLLWLKLQRPSFFSCMSAGLFYFRGTAIAYRHREESLWRLRTADFGSDILCPNLGNAERPERTRGDLEAVCRREPTLEYLVLLRPIDNVAAKIWDSPAPFEDFRVVNGKWTIHRSTRFYVYSCISAR